MTALMDRVVSQGRSTLGAAQSNDLPVNWKRFMQPGGQPKKPAKAKAKRKPANP